LIASAVLAVQVGGFYLLYLRFSKADAAAAAKPGVRT
jgi:hypothetical protein